MVSEDISRSAFSAGKRYRGVRMQQGRILTDDDWNSQDDIIADDRRATRLHVIGPAGTPDDGFEITNPSVTAQGIDFDIGAGTYYVSGHRVTLGDPVRYAAQPDWLDQPDSARTEPDGDRTDFTYLEVWEQVVTAVEDDELHEKALGGPDTTTRRRLMARVRVLVDADVDSCADGMALLRDQLAAAGRGSIDETGELVSNLSLSVTFDATADDGDLCSPSSTAGYLGAENQAVRVQLVDGDLVWGFDNAAPPYRATIDAAGTTVTLATPPRDAAHWPLAGQTVEILAPGARLENGELLAADPAGFFTTVSGAYDPDDRELTLADAHPDAADLAALGHLYVRVWQRGSDVSSPARLAVTSSTPVALGNTGLEVTVGGDDLNADAYWVIAARPQTPDEIVPWDLRTGRAPHGIRRFHAPLALIRWGAGEAGAPVVEDCRPPFDPIIDRTPRARGDCVTVGDGVISIGDFDDIQAAVDALPDVGGRVCLLPGSWDLRRPVLITGMRHVTVSGAGRASLVVASGLDRALEFRATENVHVHDLWLRSGTAPPANDLNGTITVQEASGEVVIERTLVECRGSAPERRTTAITVRPGPRAPQGSASGTPRVVVRDCEVQVGHMQTGILVIEADIATIESNLVTCAPDPFSFEDFATDHAMAVLVGRQLIDRVGRSQSAETTPNRRLVNLLGRAGWGRITTSFETHEELTSDAWRDVLANVARPDRGPQPPRWQRDADVRKLGRRLARTLLGASGGVALDTATRALFDEALRRIRIANELQAGGQGIVVAGNESGAVDTADARMQPPRRPEAFVRGNRIAGFVQGIHVGASLKKRRTRFHLRATVADNTVLLRVLGFSRERHGIFVGNCYHTHVRDNLVEVAWPGPRRWDHERANAMLSIDGVRVFGRAGPMVLVTGNQLTGVSTGVRLRLLGDGGGNPVWETLHNHYSGPGVAEVS